jgi:hypothetical protein
VILEVLATHAGCGLQPARANEVLKRHGRDLDDPRNGRFRDLLVQEQGDFLLLAVEFGCPQGPLRTSKAFAFRLGRR